MTSSTTDRIDTVTIVGGGDVGLLNALLLQRYNSDLQIRVIDDFDQPVPQVGKSTFYYIQPILHDILQIPETEFIKRVKPVWKASVYFKDWQGCDEFHVPFDDQMVPKNSNGPKKFDELCYRHDTNNFHTIGCELVHQRKSPYRWEDDPEADGNSKRLSRYRSVAYHLSTDRFNPFLRNVCRERGIRLINDRVTDVRTQNNHIVNIASEDSVYDSDLFIDATGFNRLLMGELDNEFKEFDFPLDSAVVGNADINLDEIVPATVIRTGDAGWFWQIDTYGSRDRGYVYSSSHISDEDATEEFLSHVDKDIDREDITRYRFNSGRYECAWVNNCIVVGNAYAFVEPLESTALTTAGFLAKLLGKSLANNSRIAYDGLRDLFNRNAAVSWDRIYEFLSIHYKYAPGGTPFWDDTDQVNSDTTLRQVENYHKLGFNEDKDVDQLDLPREDLFNHWLHYRVLRGIGVKSEFYESADIHPRNAAVKDVKQQNQEIESHALDYLTYEELYSLGRYQTTDQPGDGQATTPGSSTVDTPHTK